MEEYAKLTVSCGNKAQEVGRSSLGNCPAYGNGCYGLFFLSRTLHTVVLTLPSHKQQNLESSKLKEIVDDKLSFDENGRKFSKRIENTVGKGEIARYEQFLLFPLCFQMNTTADM